MAPLLEMPACALTPAGRFFGADGDGHIAVFVALEAVEGVLHAVDGDGDRAFVYRADVVQPDFLAAGYRAGGFRTKLPLISVR